MIVFGGSKTLVISLHRICPPNVENHAFASLVTQSQECFCYIKEVVQCPTTKQGGGKVVRGKKCAAYLKMETTNISKSLQQKCVRKS
jgi:hypothetical protein